ncbi:MAG: hypothetical protein ACOX2I_07960 [Candidatus Ozemobacteraceae bacterium]|jgi:cytidine deaminase|nr:hypothetical protein [Candidatus Riflebacteria bacterium]
MNKLKKNHFYLIETAKKIINARFKENRHHFVAAIRTVSGEIYTGIHLRTSQEKDDVCAEVVALANAFANGEVDIECIVVVNRIGDIMAPCGKCSEIFIELCPNAEIILPGIGGGRVALVSQLLPFRKATNPSN